MEINSKYLGIICIALAQVFFTTQDMAIKFISGNRKIFLKDVQIKTFFKIIIPISRVSIFSGLFLIVMEVLNEYGAVKYFGVNTFTSGIFRSWYSMEDVNTASILAVCLLLIVSIFFILERYSTSKYRYNYKSNDSVSGNYSTSRLSYIYIYIICLFPFVLGFFVPVIYIINNFFIFFFQAEDGIRDAH